ncbi:hypothetical protein K466DRAFT_178535 [Polyporus arcularius HHB13444]|uniref:Uncharacterized protein n=1 Tax=Polyporus arcularius HHB13444 TaxID=1314778 RepID=A0A5C3PIJ4_9APHY|nr:hypothetical protein K466DRAFT_178535 [Polyporus arcularius HHB13444]
MAEVDFHWQSCAVTNAQCRGFPIEKAIQRDRDDLFVQGFTSMQPFTENRLQISAPISMRHHSGYSPCGTPMRATTPRWPLDGSGLPSNPSCIQIVHSVL